MKYLKYVIAFVFAFVISLSLTIIIAGSVYSNPNFHDYGDPAVGLVFMIIAMILLVWAEWLILGLMDIFEFVRHPKVEIVMVEIDTNASAKEKEE